MDSVIREVYSALKEDIIRGDFRYLIHKDLKDLEIEMTDSELKTYTKFQWKKLVKDEVKKLSICIFS